jgi:hypothetical protein
MLGFGVTREEIVGSLEILASMRRWCLRVVRVSVCVPRLWFSPHDTKCH